MTTFCALTHIEFNWANSITFISEGLFPHLMNSWGFCKGIVQGHVALSALRDEL